MAILYFILGFAVLMAIVVVRLLFLTLRDGFAGRAERESQLVGDHDPGVHEVVPVDPNLSPVFGDRGENGRRWVAEQVMSRKKSVNTRVIAVRGGYQVRVMETE